MPKQQQKQYINIWNMLKMYNKDNLVHILLHFFLTLISLYLMLIYY